MRKKMILLLAGLCVFGQLLGCGGKENEKYVTLGDYREMTVELENPQVSEEDVKTYVESMLAYFPAYETTDKTVVEKGDTVDIDYEGLKDGVAFEGGTAAGYKLNIGSGGFIPGFEDGLVGANVGDSLDLNLTFPDPYKNNPDLAGQPVVFKVKVNAIVKPVPVSYDALTDEYVSANLGYESVQVMKDEVKKSLASQRENSAESNKRSAIITKLTEICAIDAMPEGVLDDRVAKYKEQMEAMCKEQYQMELSEYLESINRTEEEFNTEIVDYMKENIELELILSAIAEKEGMKVDEDGYQTFVDNMVSQYGFEDAKGLYDEYGEDYIKTSYLCSKAMDYLAENVKVTYKGSQGAEGGAETESKEDGADAESKEDGTEDTSGEQ